MDLPIEIWVPIELKSRGLGDLAEREDFHFLNPLSPLLPRFVCMQRREPFILSFPHDAIHTPNDPYYFFCYVDEYTDTKNKHVCGDATIHTFNSVVEIGKSLISGLCIVTLDIKDYVFV